MVNHSPDRNGTAEFFTSVGYKNVAVLRRSPLKKFAKPKREVYSDGDEDIVSDWKVDEAQAGEQTSFFWRAHTISVLIAVISVLAYVALFEKQIDDSAYNAKRGLIACAAVFLAFGVTQAKDGPFLRPHPAFWRFVLCCTIIYELVLIFLLFQTPLDALHWMAHLDPSLGKQLPEMDYGGNCLIYDANNTVDPFHNMWEKFDAFVPGHFVGWWFKTLVIRDYYFTNILSVLFELYEYSLEHQLPNFNECWWDHWVMDAILCNGLGIFLGMKTLQYLEMKGYTWTHWWNIPSYSGKLRRVAAQFTPYSWHQFNWNATQSLKQWLIFIFMLFLFSLAELNTFYLKFALSVPPAHWIILARLSLLLSGGAVSTREAYEFFVTIRSKKLGQQAWMMLAIIVTETLISVKFGWETIILPPPRHIIAFWSVFTVVLVGYTIVKFLPKIWLGRRNMNRSNRTQDKKSS